MSRHRSSSTIHALAVAVLVAGCGGSAASMAPLSAAPAVSSPSGALDAVRSFPPPQTAIQPGTYRWTGFDPPISVTLGPGWALGHDHPAFFDLFRGSDFPSVSFARFTSVYADATNQVAASDAMAVAATFAARSDLTVTGSSAVELGGLRGRVFDVVTRTAKTPLFFGPAGDFRLDPEFTTRYRILDIPGGGILVVGIHTRVGKVEEGLALGEPVVASLTVAP
jgi:hypothetical protein